MNEHNYRKFVIDVRDNTVRDAIHRYTDKELIAHIMKREHIYFHTTMAFILTNWRLPRINEIHENMQHFKTKK